MSVRKRAINNRLGRELQLEQDAHAQAKAALAQTQKLVAELDRELGELKLKHQTTANQLEHLLKLTAAHFTDPPQALSRESELFEIVQALAPRAIPPRQARPDEVLSAFLGMADRQMVHDVAAVIDAKGLNAPYDAIEDARARVVAGSTRWSKDIEKLP